MKSIKRIKNKIKEYNKSANNFINPLQNQIQKYIHGNEELDTIKHIKVIKNIILNYKNENFDITEVKFYEGNYYYEKDNSKNVEITNNSKYNNWAFIIRLKYKGLCDCICNLQVSGGYKGWSSKENTLYYFKPYENNIKINQVNKLQKQLDNLLKQEYITNIVGLAFKEGNVYLNYKDNYNKYTIWNCDPSNYSECITNGYDNKITEEMVKNIKNLKRCEDIEKYANEKMYGKEKSIEWIEYKL